VQLRRLLKGPSAHAVLQTDARAHATRVDQALSRAAQKLETEGWNGGREGEGEEGLLELLRFQNRNRFDIPAQGGWGATGATESDCLERVFLDMHHAEEGGNWCRHRDRQTRGDPVRWVIKIWLDSAIVVQ
jgi:hypothetical protein